MILSLTPRLTSYNRFYLCVMYLGEVWVRDYSSAIQDTQVYIANRSDFCLLGLLTILYSDITK